VTGTATDDGNKTTQQASDTRAIADGTAPGDGNKSLYTIVLR